VGKHYVAILKQLQEKTRRQEGCSGISINRAAGSQRLQLDSVLTKKKKVQIEKHDKHQWLMPMILATSEFEARAGKRFMRPPSPK
jgi:hypothetical protein